MRDIFISYSHDDFKWVNDFLIPMIESWQLEFAIDRMNFLPGRPLLSTIVEHIDTSLHVFFVCTKSFLASKYCQEELEQARSQDPASLERKAIPIVLDRNAVPRLLKYTIWCDLSEDFYDSVAWKKLCKEVGGKWSPASDRILTSQNDLSSFFGNMRDNDSETTILVRSHFVQELTGIRSVLSMESALGLSHIYSCLADAGKTKGLRLVLSDGDGNLSDSFDENQPRNLVIFGQTAQGNRILHRVSKDLIRYRQSSEPPRYCYEIRGNLFVPNQDRMSFIIYKSRTETDNTVLVLFSPWPSANEFAAQYFANNYWYFVNKEQDHEFLNIFEMEGVDKDPVLILNER